MPIEEACKSTNVMHNRLKRIYHWQESEISSILSSSCLSDFYLVWLLVWFLLNPCVLTWCEWFQFALTKKTIIWVILFTSSKTNKIVAIFLFEICMYLNFLQTKTNEKTRFVCLIAMVKLLYWRITKQWFQNENWIRKNFDRRGNMHMNCAMHIVHF